MMTWKWNINIEMSQINGRNLDVLARHAPSKTKKHIKKILLLPMNNPLIWFECNVPSIYETDAIPFPSKCHCVWQWVPCTMYNTSSKTLHLLSPTENTLPIQVQFSLSVQVIDWLNLILIITKCFWFHTCSVCHACVKNSYKREVFFWKVMQFTEELHPFFTSSFTQLCHSRR